MNRSNLFSVTSFTLLAASIYAMQAPSLLMDTGGPMILRSHMVPAAPEAWVSVPEGTRIRVRLESPLSTREARVGDAFVARVDRTVVVDGSASIPAGATVVGKVIECERPRMRSPHRMQLRFDTLDIGGDHYALASRGMPYEAQPAAASRASHVATIAAPVMVPADPAWTAPATDVSLARGTLLEFRLDRPMRVRIVQD